ncbi:MAG TPA: hypothetical protein VNF68_03010 [Candidatus Baltobacteraceae bacterium]|nr:hypothetical protein [Candidatus Baltobacteraceae bacterium]
MKLLNKVPEITLYFWIIKILATTVGETGADYLSSTLHLGLVITSYAMSALFLVALIAQLRTKRYVAGVYWTVVVLISVVGTLVSDNLVDNLGVTLVVSSALFAGCLAVVFFAWWMSERTLSVHSIATTKRELFYWAAILFTFALGTSAGDLLSEASHLGYAVAALVFAGSIAITAIAYYRFKVDGVLAFWIAYILTRPLGASLGDLLSQSHKNGGFGFGTMPTSVVFLITIVGLVMYLTRTKADVIPDAISQEMASPTLVVDVPMALGRAET